MCGWPLLVLWALLPATAAGSSGRSYPHRVVLDPEGKYWLHWGRHGERLAFRLEVRTNGYVGFGFSPTGTMAAADIVVGGVAHGRPYLQVSSVPSGSSLLWDRSGRAMGCGVHPKARLIPAPLSRVLLTSFATFCPRVTLACPGVPACVICSLHPRKFPFSGARILVPHLTGSCAQTTQSPSPLKKKKKIIALET